MKIGTYNVLGLTGYPKNEGRAAIGAPGEDSNCEHFARVFSELGCDILALQEGVTVRTMQNIARAMNRHMATFPSPIDWHGHVLSRFPILESRVFSHFDPTQQTPAFSRTIGAALLAVGEEMLWIVDVHLHPGDIELRITEGRILKNRLEELERATKNIIVLGDFNSEVHEEVHQLIKALGFANVMENSGGGIQTTTDTVGIRHHSIDHIYVSSPLIPNIRSAAVIRDQGFRNDGPQTQGVWVHSDHLPVIASLDFPS